MTSSTDDQIHLEALPADVPVVMPELPEILAITTAEQFKALGNPLRTKITLILQNQPTTTKQLAQHLGIAPGTMSHHVHILEKAGLIQVIALRIVRGTIAKYYARTAYMYGFNPAHAAIYTRSIAVDMARQALDELKKARPTLGKDDWDTTWFPHRRIPNERMEVYTERLATLVADFLREPIDANAPVQGLFVALFTAPPALPADDPAAAVAPPLFPNSD